MSRRQKDELDTSEPDGTSVKRIKRSKVPLSLDWDKCQMNEGIQMCKFEFFVCKKKDKMILW